MSPLPAVTVEGYVLAVPGVLLVGVMVEAVRTVDSGSFFCYCNHSISASIANTANPIPSPAAIYPIYECQIFIQVLI
jgi:hypothetical protein